MAGTESFSTNLNLAVSPEFSNKDYPEIYVDALKVRNAIRVIQSALDRYTGMLPLDAALWSTAGATQVRTQNTTQVYAIAEVAMPAGAIVNFYDVGGKLTARKANATATGKSAQAFCLQDVTVGAFGRFALTGVCKNIGGLTTGATYYLSNTDGLIAASSGTILQRVGFALGASTLHFSPELV